MTFFVHSPLLCLKQTSGLPDCSLQHEYVLCMQSLESAGKVEFNLDKKIIVLSPACFDDLCVAAPSNVGLQCSHSEAKRGNMGMSMSGELADLTPDKWVILGNVTPSSFSSISSSSFSFSSFQVLAVDKQSHNVLIATKKHNDALVLQHQCFTLVVKGVENHCEGSAMNNEKTYAAAVSTVWATAFLFKRAAQLLGKLDARLHAGP